MSHTEGKLTLGNHGVIYGGPFREYVRGSAQDQFAMVTSAHEDEIEQGITQEENARRLVACWNACAEISTDTLEMHGFRTVLADLQRQINEQWKERDELKAEIERLRNALQSPESIIALIGSNFSSKSKSMDGDLASVKYVLTAHDLVSAFSSLFDDKQEVK